MPVSSTSTTSIRSLGLLCMGDVVVVLAPFSSSLPGILIASSRGRLRSCGLYWLRVWLKPAPLAALLEEGKQFNSTSADSRPAEGWILLLGEYLSVEREVERVLLLVL